MKKIFVVLSFLLLSVFTLSACKNLSKDDSYIETTSPDIFDFDRNYGDKKVAVVYFSATGNTKAAAEKIKEVMGDEKVEMIEIVPKEAYTDTDLTSYDPSTRPQRERVFDPMSIFEEPEEDAEEVDENAITKLPDIKNVNVKKYDLIFLGYPIWFGDAPRVIYSFIKNNNLNKKSIVPFCTSDNDDVSPSDNNLAAFAYELYNDTTFMGGLRVTKSMTTDEIERFIKDIGPDI